MQQPLQPELRSARKRPRLQESFIPISEEVKLTQEEISVLNHPALQRLGEIYQLGFTHLVFRGATHKRLEHSKGTVHVAQTIIDSLWYNATVEREPEDEGDNYIIDPSPLTSSEVAFARLAALVHDVGHLPCGHTFEDELALLDKHDSDSRLKLVLGRTSWHSLEEEESLAGRIDRLYKKHANDAGLSSKPHEVLLWLISKDHADEQAPTGSSFRLGVCRDLVGNTVCADLLDYLHRDWHHLGKPRYFDTRPIDYMEVRQDVHEHERSGPNASHLVVNLRDLHNVRSDAVSAILSLLDSRYDLFEIALYHKTKLAASAVLERALLEIRDALTPDEREQWRERLTERLLDCSDAEMLSVVAQEARDLAQTKEGTVQKRLLIAGERALGLRLRRTYKPVYQAFSYALGMKATNEAQERYSPSSRSGAEAAAETRLFAVRQIEQDFHLPPLSLAMYCPPRETAAKIAEVDILVSDVKRTLDDYERGWGGDPGLTGGKLKGQDARFSSLWRVLVACERETWRELKRRGADRGLRMAIGCWLVDRTEPGELRKDRALAIARELAHDPAFPWWKDKEARFPEKAAAHGAEISFYPSGLPAVRYFFE